MVGTLRFAHPARLRLPPLSAHVHPLRINPSNKRWRSSSWDVIFCCGCSACRFRFWSWFTPSADCT